MVARGVLLCLVLGGSVGCIRSAASTDGEAAGNSPKGPYLVVSLVDGDDPFARAAEALASRHRADKVTVRPDELESTLPKLRTLQPAYVAIVVSPGQLDINLVNRVFTLATQVDDDPFVDFAYGFITGRDADAAVGLVQASDRKSRAEPRIVQFGVGSSQLPRSMTQNAAWPLRSGTVPVNAWISRGDTDQTRDEAFLKEALPHLDRSPIILLASHGYPDGLVGGPKAVDIKGRDFSGSVLLNIACYTGVTNRWYEDDWTSGKVRQREVAADDSFCLQVIDNGVAGYIAYACPRPAGPTMMGDALLIASSGQTLGQLWREQLNSVVLAHLATGSDHAVARPIRSGDALNPQRTAGEVVRKMSTGGMLIGDPAFQPFLEKRDSDPRIVRVDERDGEVLVEVQITTATFHFFAGEPINYWNDREPALRLEASVDIGNKQVKEVQLLKSNLGDVPHRIVAAIEEDENRRLLRVKAVLAQPELRKLQGLAATGLTGTFKIITGDAGPQPQAGVVFRRGSDD